MNFSRSVILFLVVLSLGFNSCKKGEEDPAISLKTRTSRMSGRWTMTRGNAGFTSYSANTAPFNTNFEFTGSDGTGTQNGKFTYPFKYTVSLTFSKNGKMSLSENFDGSILMASGTWNFSGGVGKSKSKSDLSIKLDGVTSGDTQEHLFNYFGTEITYHIKRLSNDDLLLYTNTIGYVNISGDKGVFQGEFTFKKNK